MFSARLVGRLARFHGQRSETSSGRPSAVNQPRTGQLPVASAIARMPARGMFSTGLPSTQPAARPSHAPAIRSGRSRASLPLDRVGRGEDLLEPLRLGRRERAGQRVELVEQIERERPQLRRDGLLGGAAAREPARRRPRTSARSTPSTSLPSSRACRSSCPTRSSGCTQVTLRLKQAPRRP